MDKETTIETKTRLSSGIEMTETTTRLSSRIEYLTQELDTLHSVIKKQGTRLEDLEIFVASLSHLVDDDARYVQSVV